MPAARVEHAFLPVRQARAPPFNSVLYAITISAAN